MVKIIKELYSPRLRTGAISEVTARAVSSLMPAPESVNMCSSCAGRRLGEVSIRTNARDCHSADESVHRVCSACDNHAENQERRTRHGDVSAAEQI